MNDAAKRGRRNRQRGQEGEREVCKLFRDAYGSDVKRNLGQERDSGSDICIDPFVIEVKRRKRIAGLYEWLGQAMGPAADSGGIPAVALRQDGSEWLVVMTMADFLTLAREEIAASKNA